jgi:hypothetical protein
MQMLRRAFALKDIFLFKGISSVCMLFLPAFQRNGFNKSCHLFSKGCARMLPEEKWIQIIGFYFKVFFGDKRGFRFGRKSLILLERGGQGGFELFKTKKGK